MKIIGVIPARFASSRFPGKPLANICGKPMIWWVYQEAKKLQEICEVYVATESPIVVQECRKLNINVILTSDEHASGTDRVAEVARIVDADWYLIWMGDEPLIKSQEVRYLLQEVNNKKNYEVYMLAKHFDNPVDVVNSTTIKLAINKHQELIFMSRSCIPFPKAALDYHYYKNIGAYLMSAEALRFFAHTEIGYLENIEDIELLRFLENYKKIYVSILQDCISMSVDTPKDLQRVIKLMETTLTRDSISFDTSSGGGVDNLLKRQCTKFLYISLDKVFSLTLYSLYYNHTSFQSVRVA